MEAEVAANGGPIPIDQLLAGEVQADLTTSWCHEGKAGWCIASHIMHDPT